MFKVTENPNYKSDFKNIAAQHVTQFSHTLQVTDEAFYAKTQKEIMKTYFWHFWQQTSQGRLYFKLQVL